MALSTLSFLKKIELLSHAPSAAKTSSSAGLNTGATLLATFGLQELICTLPL
jgi:hypothetical protein